MTKLDIQYDLLNDTPANASPPQSNFNRIEQHVNQELIERDGTVAMRAQLRLIGDPVAVLDAAPKQYVDAVMPVGIIMMFGGAAAPPGGKWALCNGAELETTAYPDLYAIVGTSYVVGTPAAGRFNLPNLANRMPLGAGTAALGATGGSAAAAVVNHVHPVSSHTHTMGNHTHVGGTHIHTLGGHTHVGTTASADATHYHLGGDGAATLLAATDQGNGLYGGFTGGIGALYYSGTNAVAAPHVHTFGTSGPSTDSGSAGAVSTGAPSPNTTDGTAVTTSNPTGGVDPTNANLPPYVAVQYIIRVL